ncbi:MAG: tRNA pseudouridine(38-40) synthase TruA [Flavobacteriales bacterium]
MEQVLSTDDKDAKSENGLWPRYFMHVSYDGTNYHGWQRQPNGNSVQAEVEHALSKLHQLKKVITTGCGRTDAGVHARNFYLHFNIENGISDLDEVFFRLSHILPRDIAVHHIMQVHDMAHSRFDATERSYEYHMHQKRNPFIRTFSTYYHPKLNIEKMNEAASLMLPEEDFATFCKAGGGQKTTICHLRRAEWEVTEGGLIFHITADRFLRNMVRAVVGTLVKVGQGKMSVSQFEEVLKSRTRIEAGESMQPQGLHLTVVKYPYINQYNEYIVQGNG